MRLAVIPETGERRKATRYTCVVEGCAERVSPSPGGPFQIAATNISLTGMMIHGHAEMGAFVSSGDLVCVKISDPETASPLDLPAVVMWKTRNHLNVLGQWSFGVRFHGAPEKVVLKVHDVVVKGWSGPASS